MSPVFAFFLPALTVVFLVLFLKGAFHEVAPDVLMGALLSSGKDSSSSLRETKRSSIIHLGGKLLAAADMATHGK